MRQKLPTFKEYISEELKDKEFREFYEEEGRKLNIGLKIARLRERLGFTQKQLAEKIKTSQNFLCVYIVKHCPGPSVELRDARQ